MKINLTVCDICQDPRRSATTYRISSSEGRSVSTDRCEEHGKAFEEALELGQSTRRAPATYESRKTTIEEIEARKKARFR